MPTANWLTAFKKANIKPVVLMQIEDAAAKEQLYTTKSQWAGSTTLTNIDTGSSPGDAVGNINEVLVSATDASSATSCGARWTFVPSIGGFYHRHNQLSFQFKTSSTGGAIDSGYYNTRFTVRSTGFAGTILHDATTSIYYNRVQGFGFGSFNTYTSGTFGFLSDTELTAATTYYIEVQVFGLTNIQSNPYTITLKSADLDYTPKLGADCTLTTSTIDMGLVPSDPVELSIDDTKESGAAIVYTAEGNTVDSWPGTSLGTVADGDSLTAYEFYRITAVITSSTGGRGTIHQLALREGIYKWYGTHKDIPFVGVKPYLRSGQSVSNKIDLLKGLATTGEFTADLFFVDDTSDFIASRFLLGKDVQVSVGTPELSLADFEPIITGTWRDYSFNGRDKRMTVKIQDPMKQFVDRELPIVSFNPANGANLATDIDYLKTNGVGVILDLYDRVGLRDRYIPDDYATLQAGALSSTDYNVTRRLYGTVPDEVVHELNTLAEALGLFLVALGDGSIKPKLYDATEAAAWTLDASKFSPSEVKGNYGEISTRHYAWYNYSLSTRPEPDSDGDFKNGYSDIDAGRESLLGGEGHFKDYFDLWRIGNNQPGSSPENIQDLTVPPQALIDLTERYNSWFADPKFTVDMKGMPLWYWQIEPSDIVEINNLYVPVSNTAWVNSVDYVAGAVIINDGRMYECTVANGISTTVYEPGTTVGWEGFWEDKNTLSTGLTDGMKFITMKRTIDLKRGSVSFQFRQI